VDHAPPRHRCRARRPRPDWRAADHPSTLAFRNNLAGTYRAAGRAAEAIPLLERTLADRERVLGADHPSTLTSRNNLASAYQEAADDEGS
jgi:hypothetical protein